MLGVLLSGAENAAAQSADGVVPASTRVLLVPPLMNPAETVIRGLASGPDDSTSLDGTDLFASLLVPGAGQLISGQGRRRGWVMLGLDVLLWSAVVVEERAGDRDRDRYRDLAWTAARDNGQSRVDGDFDYYERMTQWTSSGTFDSDPLASGVQPETRPTTFNGDAWRLARSLFLGGQAEDPNSPGFAAAIQFYEGRAYRDGLLWDWSGAQDAQMEFKNLIRSSDDHRRRATWAVAGAIGNRVVSFLDLFISSRSGGRMGLELKPGQARSARLSVRWHPSMTSGTGP